MRVRRHPGRLHCASIAHRQIHQRRVLAATMAVIGEHWQNEFLCRRIVYTAGDSGWCLTVKEP